jgi:hypothetical protein
MRKKTSNTPFLKLAPPAVRRRSKVRKILPISSLLILLGILILGGFEVERVNEPKSNSKEKGVLLRLKKKKKDLPQKKKIETAHWPALSLSGLGCPSAGKRAYAIINHHHQAVGEIIDGVKLLEVKDRGVIVSYQGEKRILALER